MNGTRAGYIAGPVLDAAFLIGAPLVAAVLFLPVRLNPLFYLPFPEGSPFKAESLATAMIEIVIFSHLFLVFFRSHLNRGIFKQHVLRFTAVPALLFLGMMASSWVLTLTAVLAIWWDVYHSGMQTFGIGRIYDMKQGNDPLAGRRLDQILNLLLYAGPILGGASLMLHLAMTEDRLRDQPGFDPAFFEWVPGASTGHSRPLTYAILALGVPFLVYYVYAYWRLHRNGYKVSFQKVALLVILATVSITCWGFNSFGEAFWIMNFFHAWQYWFLVWFMERKNITTFFHVGRFPFGQQLALALFVLIGVGYGIWTNLDLPAIQFSKRAMISIVLVVSIMHFWYDGFIWSVRKREV